MKFTSVFASLCLAASSSLIVVNAWDRLDPPLDETTTGGRQLGKFMKATTSGQHLKGGSHSDFKAAISSPKSKIDFPPEEVVRRLESAKAALAAKEGEDHPALRHLQQGSGCTRIGIWFYIEDLNSRRTTTSNGAAYDSVPYYDQETGELLGYYTDSATILASGECVGTSTFSLGGSPDYPSQINLSFSCNGLYNAITGGNGQFGCANGVESYFYEDDLVIASNLNLCGFPCPLMV